MRVERRSAICVFVLEVELVRELVEHDVVAVARITCAVAHGIPCEYQRTQPTSGVAKPVFGAFFPDSATDVTHVFFGVCPMDTRESR